MGSEKAFGSTNDAPLWEYNFLDKTWPLVHLLSKLLVWYSSGMNGIHQGNIQKTWDNQPN